MKKYLLLFLILLTVFGTTKAKHSKRCVYIDPGHGGVDPGAFYGGVKEKNINLQIALKLKDELKDDVIVYLTREGDYDLSKTKNGRKKSDLYERSKLINNSSCDLYISIHLNAYHQTRWSGSQVFYNKVNKNNIKLAEIISDKLNKRLNNNRKYKEVKGYLYERVKVPGVLVEVGFLSNPYEREKLKTDEYQSLVAGIMKDGILEYLAKY